MSSSLKKKAREIQVKTGISYQAAFNQLRRPSTHPAVEVVEHPSGDRRKLTGAQERTVIEILRRFQVFPEEILARGIPAIKVDVGSTWGIGSTYAGASQEARIPKYGVDIGHYASSVNPEQAIGVKTELEKAGIPLDGIQGIWDARPAIPYKLERRFLGVVRAPDGRRAVVTEAGVDEEAVRRAANAWAMEAEHERAAGDKTPYVWVEHPEISGFYRIVANTVFPAPVPLKRP